MHEAFKYAIASVVIAVAIGALSFTLQHNWTERQDVKEQHWIERHEIKAKEREARRTEHPHAWLLDRWKRSETRKPKPEEDNR